MAEQYDIVMPEFNLGTLEVPVDDKQVMDVMVLEINTASTSMTVRLADKSNYRQVADKLGEGIRRMGASMRGPHVKLITDVKEIPDGLRKTPKGR